MRVLRIALFGAAVLGAYCQEPDAESSSGKEGGAAGEETGEGGKSRKELAQGLSFCEYDNCYELLGVRPESGPIPIKRAYRRLASQWHPDKCTGGDVEKCRELFPKYANAYDVLSNSEMRKNYDYVLANPYEFPSFYLKYSRPKYAPKSDLRFVFFITLLGAAGAHHFLKRSTYEQAIARMKKDPRARYQERLKALVSKVPVEKPPPSPTKEVVTKEASGKPASGGRGEAAAAKVNKAAQKSEELERRKKVAEAQLEAEMADELGLAPPILADNVAISVFKLPLTVSSYTLWLMAGGMREPAYMTRRALGLSADEWDSYDEAEQTELLARELWVSDNLATYEEEMSSSERGKPKSGKQKREARAQKKAARNPTSTIPDD